MTPTFFKTPAEFRKWLERNHEKETELLVGFYKKGSGKASITWPESVDEALCFGWIDGIRRSVDEETYTIRFTPRKPGSVWSAVNIKKIAELTEKGLMKPAGLAAFAKIKEDRSNIYSYETEAMELDKAYEKQFKANKKAWAFFQAQRASYRKIAIRWVMTAKQQATRNSRMQALISDSEAGMLIKSQRYGTK
jgi:uncharacterized protein YdeI (YjbR/CyaY-like superfamily)